MEPFKEASVLIIDDDDDICQLLKDLFSSLGARAASIAEPKSIIERIQKNSYDVCLLDVLMPEVSGLDVIPQMSEHCPDSKIIIMTGHADKDTVIRALKLGAFDFLEKPFELDLIIHSVRRALDTLEAERNQRRLVEALKESQEELLSSKKQMEYLNDQLMATNKALSILAQNVVLEREQAERQIAFKLKSLVIPVVEKLRQHRHMDRYGAELHMLISQIMGDLTSGFTKDPTIVSNLSPTELRIASLIRNGLSTDEIADHLNIASSTVRTHRKNIRRKLKINDTHYSLRNFLLSKYKSSASG